MLKSPSPAIGLLLLALSPFAAHSQSAATLPSHASPHNKLSQDALKADPNSQVKVIVRFNDANESHWEATVGAHAGLVHKHFSHTGAVAAELPASALAELASEPGVDYVSIDRPLHPRGGPTVSIATSAEYTVEPINAPAVWAQGWFGTGVGVAVIDSGIANQPDLGPQAGGPQRLVYNASFPSNLAGGTQDSYGHGTHVAGLIAGNGNHSTGNQYTRTFRGVAPNANLVNLRVLDQNGAGTDSAVIEAIEAAIALKSTYNIRVINLSLGRPIYESYTQDPLCQAVEAAWKAGIVVVVAAGNDGRDQSYSPEGYGTIEAPGNDPYVITVGAMNTMNTPVITDDVIASYSSKGPSMLDNVAKPDIVAPGNLVTSLLKGGSTLQKQAPTFFTPKSFYINTNESSSSPDYTPLSGTSMATAVTSGAVALLLQAQPQLTPDAVKALLMVSAQHNSFPLTSTATDPTTGVSYMAHYDAFTVGAGYLDILATLTNAQQYGSTLPQGTAMSPTAVVSSDGGTTLVTDQTALWGRSAILGAGSVYGQNSFVSGSTALWGRTTLTGSGDPAGFTSLWGRSDLFGTTALWGRSSLFGSTALWGRSTDKATSQVNLTDKD